MRTNLMLACLIFSFVSALAVAGDMEPPAPPGPTMKTLNEIPPTWSQILDSTDGDPVTGCDSSRFKCVMGGEAVLDLETGLVWERVPSSSTFMNWLANRTLPISDYRREKRLALPGIRRTAEPTRLLVRAIRPA